MAAFRVGVDPGWGNRLEPLLGPALKDFFHSAAFEWEVMAAAPDGVAQREIVDQYDGLLVLQTAFPAETFDGLKRLACIARWGVGFDKIDTAAATAGNVLVALTPTAIKRAVAESEIALIFALAKQLPALDRRTRAGQWRSDLPIVGVDVAGKTVSSIGLGNIAKEMFKMARGVGFGRLLAHDPYAPAEQAAQLGVELVDLDTVFREADFVTVNTFLSDDTRGMVNARLLSLMKPSAYFVNTARGPIVDEPALIEVLSKRRIAGAGIDVFEQEPPPKDHPLFAMDNVILAPHAVAWTKEGLAGNSSEACENLARVARGECPPFLANPEAAAREGVKRKLALWRQP